MSALATYGTGCGCCLLLGGATGGCLGVGVDLEELASDLDGVTLLGEVLRDHASVL